MIFPSSPYLFITSKLGHLWTKLSVFRIAGKFGAIKGGYHEALVRVPPDACEISVRRFLYSDSKPLTWDQF